MIIDDSNTIRKTADAFLKNQHEVFLVPDGFIALTYVSEFKPDIIFVDVMMPNLSGYDFCQLIKNHDEFSHIPVIILSSKDGVFDKIKGRVVGADQYLTKPFKKEQILEVVDSYLQ